ncbi:MAG: hypothetical protein ACKOXB_07735 [Flavobacteriales bacterium]
MTTDLNFEDESTKSLLAKLDFEFFLKRNIEEEKYNQASVNEIYQARSKALSEINIKHKENRKQFNLFCEGYVRRMFTGGFLPSTFLLNDLRSFKIIDFSETGRYWAYFEHWQKYQKRKVTKEKLWNFVVKSGSLLGIVLSVIKVIEWI